MKTFLRRALGMLLLAAGSGGNGVQAVENPVLDKPVEGAVMETFYANRVIFYPITSFHINGVNGKYERRVLNRRLGLSLPFYLGRSAVADVGTHTTLGAGLGLDLFVTSKPSGGHFSATLELIDLRRRENIYYTGDSDPTFPNSFNISLDLYHEYMLTLSFLSCYRWEYPSRHFLIDLGIGANLSRFRGPKGKYSNPPMRYNGFWPVGNFSIGYPF